MPNIFRKNPFCSNNIHTARLLQAFHPSVAVFVVLPILLLLANVGFAQKSPESKPRLGGVNYVPNGNISDSTHLEFEQTHKPICSYLKPTLENGVPTQSPEGLYKYFISLRIKNEGGRSFGIKSIGLSFQNPFGVKNKIETFKIINYKTGQTIDTSLDFFYEKDEQFLLSFNLDLGPYSQIPNGNYRFRLSFESFYNYLGPVEEDPAVYTSKANFIHFLTTDSLKCAEQTPLFRADPNLTNTNRLGTISPSQPTLHLYPNPTRNISNLEFNLEQDSKVNLFILNAMGKRIMNPILNEGKSKGLHKMKIDISSLPPGFYFTVLNTSSGNKVFKWLKIE